MSTGVRGYRPQLLAEAQLSSAQEDLLTAAFPVYGLLARFQQLLEVPARSAAEGQGGNTGDQRPRPSGLEATPS